MQTRTGIAASALVGLFFAAVLIAVRFYKVSKIADEILAAARSRDYPTMTIPDLRQQLYGNGYKIEGSDGAIVSYGPESLQPGANSGPKFVRACVDVGPRVPPFFVEHWMALIYEFDADGHFLGVTVMSDYYHPGNFVAPGDKNPWGRE